MSKINFMKTMKVPTSSFNKDNKYIKVSKDKDSSWNNRFHLEKIPSYNAFNDPNSKIYQVKLRSILKSLHSKPIKKKSHSPIKQGNNYDDLLKLDNRAITNRFYKEMNRDIDKEISQKINEPITEEMNMIQSFWDDLGVQESFRVIFKYICLELDQNSKKGYQEFELSNLKKLSEYFTKLTKEMQGRERVISLLRQYNNFLENDNISPKLTSDIIQTFKNLRILSINIIHIFLQIREITSYSILCGKFDFNKINKNFNYDRNYLIKMRTDTDFLKQSNLSNYFNIASNVSDPFLLSLSNENVNSEKLSVPITEEMLNSVKKCQLVILQDQLFYEMNLSMLNHQNNYDFSNNQKNNAPNNFNNNNYQKKSSDKKVNSATIRIYEKQHNELTIKSKNDAPKDNNNIRVHARVNSGIKRSLEDNNDKSLNDSRYKKSQNQKVEKLDIQIKEKQNFEVKEINQNEDINEIYKDFEEKVFDKNENQKKVDVEAKYESFITNGSKESSKKMKSLKTNKINEKIESQKSLLLENTKKVESIKESDHSLKKYVEEKNISNMRRSSKNIETVDNNSQYHQKNRMSIQNKEISNNQKSDEIDEEIKEKNNSNTALNKANQDSNLKVVFDDENSNLEKKEKKEANYNNLEENAKEIIIENINYPVIKSKDNDFEINDIDELSFESEKDQSREEKGHVVKRETQKDLSILEKNHSNKENLKSEPIVSLNNTIEPINEMILTINENQDTNLSKNNNVNLTEKQLNKDISPFIIKGNISEKQSGDPNISKDSKQIQSDRSTCREKNGYNNITEEKGCKINPEKEMIKIENSSEKIIDVSSIDKDVDQKISTKEKDNQQIISSNKNVGKISFHNDFENPSQMNNESDLNQDIIDNNLIDPEKSIQKKLSKVIDSSEKITIITSEQKIIDNKIASRKSISKVKEPFEKISDNKISNVELSNKEINKINPSEEKINDRSQKRISKVEESNKEINELNLLDEKISHKSQKSISKIEESNKKINEVNASKEKLLITSQKSISKVELSNKEINYINLSEEKINDKSQKSISKVEESNKEINASIEKITNKSQKSISKIEESNKEINEVNPSEEKITNKSQKSISKVENQLEEKITNKSQKSISKVEESTKKIPEINPSEEKMNHRSQKSISILKESNKEINEVNPSIEKITQKNNSKLEKINQLEEVYKSQKSISKVEESSKKIAEINLLEEKISNKSQKSISKVEESSKKIPEINLLEEKITENKIISQKSISKVEESSKNIIDVIPLEEKITENKIISQKSISKVEESSKNIIDVIPLEEKIVNKSHNSIIKVEKSNKKISEIELLEEKMIEKKIIPEVKQSEEKISENKINSQISISKVEESSKLISEVDQSEGKISVKSKKSISKVDGSTKKINDIKFPNEKIENFSIPKDVKSEEKKVKDENSSNKIMQINHIEGISNENKINSKKSFTDVHVSSKTFKEVKSSEEKLAEELILNQDKITEQISDKNDIIVSEASKQENENICKDTKIVNEITHLKESSNKKLETIQKINEDAKETQAQIKEDKNLILNENNQISLIENENLLKEEISIKLSKEHNQISQENKPLDNDKTDLISKQNVVEDIISVPIQEKTPKQDEKQSKEEAKNVEEINQIVLINTQNIEKRTEVCENPSDLKIEFFTSDLMDLQEKYNSYYKSIPEDQLISFKIKKELKDYISGNNFKIITIENKHIMCGLCIINFDSNQNELVRIYLTHFSTLFQNFAEILVEINNFLFKTLKFSEIIVYLYYKKLQGKFELVSSIRNAFKDILKFRWVKLENTGDERFLVMNLKNSNQSLNFKYSPDFNFSLKYDLAYQLDLDDGNKPSHNLENERYLNPLPLIISFSNLGADSGFDVDYNFLKSINNNALNRHYPHFMKVQTDEKAVLEQAIKIHLNDINYDNFNEGSRPTSALVNISQQFDSVLSQVIEIDGKNYYYNRINMNRVEIHTNESFNLTFYNIPFTDDRHSLFIGEVSDEFINSSNNNILTDFFILKSKLVCKKIDNMNIWVPCFDLKIKRNFNKLHYLDDVKISHSSQNYSASNFTENMEISMKYDHMIEGNCKIKPENENDVVIKKNFLFAIINIDLANELNLAAIFVNLVKKDNWTQKI